MLNSILENLKLYREKHPYMLATKTLKDMKRIYWFTYSCLLDYTGSTGSTGLTLQYNTFSIYNYQLQQQHLLLDN